MVAPLACGRKHANWVLRHWKFNVSCPFLSHSHLCCASHIPSQVSSIQQSTSHCRPHILFLCFSLSCSIHTFHSIDFNVALGLNTTRNSKCFGAEWNLLCACCLTLRIVGAATCKPKFWRATGKHLRQCVFQVCVRTVVCWCSLVTLDNDLMVNQY